MSFSSTSSTSSSTSSSAAQVQGMFKKAKSLLGIEQAQKRAWYEELEEEVCTICPSLTWQQRIIGCFSCIAIGFILSMGSLFRLMQLLAGEPIPFATMYTLGNIISICATCFLYGPWSQMKKMFASTRIIATSVFVVMMIITLFLAFYPGYIPVRALWIVIAIFIQFLALVWYTLSYIPFARDMVKNCFMDCFCDCTMCKSNDGWESWHG